MGQCHSEKKPYARRTQTSVSSAQTSKSTKKRYGSFVMNPKKDSTQKTDQQLLSDIFDRFDKNKDSYLDYDEVESFWIYLNQKKKMSILVDQNFIGSFLCKAGVIDETGICKEDFLKYFRNL
jgi:hypothetical protein